jgi:hypothetical protein
MHMKQHHRYNRVENLDQLLMMLIDRIDRIFLPVIVLDKEKVIKLDFNENLQQTDC